LIKRCLYSLADVQVDIFIIGSHSEYNFAALHESELANLPEVLEGEAAGHLDKHGLTISYYLLSFVYFHTLVVRKVKREVARRRVIERPQKLRFCSFYFFIVGVRREDLADWSSG
jgi:hypothetical protein